MPQEILFGEIANRLRNLLRTVGRQGTRVDETITPVVIAGNVNVDPFRADPRTWSDDGNIPAPPAGDFATFGVTCAPGELLVVDAAEAFVSAAGAVIFHIVRQTPVSAVLGFLDLGALAVVNAPGKAGGGVANTISHAFSATPAAVGLTANSFEIWRSIVAGSTAGAIYHGAPVVLFPGDTFAIQNGTAAQTMTGLLSGRAYDPSFIKR